MRILTASSHAFCELPVRGASQQVPREAGVAEVGAGTCLLLPLRYKSLCPETWPTWAGRPQDGVAVLVRHLGYKPEEYKMGR